MKYQIRFTIETKSEPKDILDFIRRRVKDALPVISMEYDLVEDRPLTTEHHGGIQDED
tara:strand:+ start:459 stop:632 length:174 start_codon:yes stop_codon:yes gene_type:complete